MSEMKLFEQIEDYLKNRLSPSDAQAFEAEMATNPGLAKEVSLHRDMMEMMEEEEEKLYKSPPDKDLFDFRDLMENAYQEFVEDKKEEKDSPDLPSPSAGKGGLRFWIIGAMVALIGLAIWYSQSQPATEIGKQVPNPIDTIQSVPQNQEPIAQTPPPQTPPNIAPPSQDYASLVQKSYAEAPYKPGVLMSDPNEPEDSLIQKAMEAYTQKQFRRTVDLLQPLPEEGQTDALKLRAHALFQLGRYDAAATDFEALSKGISYRNDAEWHLLLCHAARLPKTKIAYEAMLAKVNKAGHPFEQKARNLKAKLLEK